ncbi:hypothetical protein M493_15900 [Geobacillus genomosp. 3]|uniref:YitT family protein n=1 Tax=Geobacillus genomosp. 3 TaxID=1921421 RepID=S6A3U2_GEOG3|nr:YitT family protein [Geobacillus genomosp. 3]AGT33396.1 hypothetical protein M493_15900 [Geobacillus genomosp. 3]
MDKQLVSSPSSVAYILGKKYLLVVIGSIIQGAAMGVFLFPNAIPSGGAGGITVLLNHLFRLPTSIGLWIVNASALLVAFRYLGGASAVGTVISITVTSVSIQFFETHWHTPLPNVWADAAAGSIVLGVGIAILLRQGVSHGGIGIIALLIARSKHVNPGRPLFWINGAIFLLIGYIIDWHLVPQAIGCQWLSTRVVDWLYSTPMPRRISTAALGWRKR